MVTVISGTTKRRVAFFALQLGPGGVTTHMRALAEQLQERDWEVALVSRGQFGTHAHGQEWFESIGIRHFTVPFPRLRANLQTLYELLRTSRELQAMVRDFRPDIIHVHWRVTSMFARIVQYRFGIPFVSTLHITGTPASWIHRKLSFWGEQAIAVSSETRKELLGVFDVPSERVRTIFYGVDSHYFRPPSGEERATARQDLDLASNAFVVALVGSGWRRKGHDVLLNALGRLHEIDTSVVAVFAGDETERDTIERMAADNRVANRVKIVGYQDSRRVLWASDAFVLPSRKEGLPISIIEAMHCGVVPIRTPSGGAHDQIQDGVNGFIVPFDTPQTIADRLLQLYRDDSLLQRMSHEAIRTGLERFTVSRMAEDVIAVYEEALSSCE